MKTTWVTTILVFLLITVQQTVHAQERGYDVTYQNIHLVSLQEDTPEQLCLVDPYMPDRCEDLCCCPWACCTSNWQFFGEFLYLRPRDAEVVYAVPVDGAIVPPDGVAPIQVGPAGIVDPDYQPGFRVGFARALDECSHLAAAFTHFESNTANQISSSPGNVIRSMVFHPGTANASADFLDAQAGYDVDFQLVDLDYRRMFSCGEFHDMSYLIGVRYANLRQDFSAQFGVLGTERILTGIEFDGGGIRVGWEGERYARGCGLMMYGRATANFVSGEFKARYLQSEAFDPEVVNTSWKAGRIVTMLDLELGIGWVSPCNRYRFTTGYVVNSWFNTVKTSDWIGAVQNNDFVDLGDTLTFDGLVARAEMRF